MPATSTPNSGTDRLTKTLALGLIASAFALLYYLRSSEQASNAMHYILSALTGDEMFVPPQHLLHAAILRVIYLASSLFVVPDALLIGQLHSMFWATVAIFSIFLIARRLFRSVAVALAASALLLMINAFWTYSTQSETYVPMLAPLTLLAASMVLQRDRPLQWPQRLLWSACLFVGVMYHQSAVLFVVPMSVYFLWTQGLRRWRDLAIVFFVSGGATLLVYLLVYLVTQTTDISRFIEWVLLYGYQYQELGTLDNFSLWGMKELIKSQLSSIIVLPEALGALRAPLRALFIAVLGLTLVWNARQIVTRGPFYRERTFFLLWYAVSIFFCIWWQPDVYKFLFPSIFPVALLVVFTACDLLQITRDTRWYRLSIQAALLVLMFVLTIANFNYSFLPVHYSKGAAYRTAAALVPLADAKCMRYVHGYSSLQAHYYFSEMSVASYDGLFDRYVEDGDSAADVCAIVPAYFFSANEYNKWAGLRGTSDGRETFVAWMLNADGGSMGPMAHDPYTVVADANGTRYLIIDRSSPRATAANAVALTAQVDLDVVRADVADTTAQSADEEYDRRLVFGY